MPALEADVQRHPTDGNLLTKLGVGYYGQKNWERARDAFKAAIAVDANNYRAIVYLGLTYEELGSLDSARATYGVARTKAKGDRQKTELDNRLALLTHKELQAAARVALAQESTLSRQAPQSNTIAVFPFRYLGTNEQMKPLERGIAQLVVADLGKVSALKLLEREQVQALVDEMKLAESGRVDPATGARSGRILRAQNVVQGSIQETGTNGVQLDANAVNSTTAAVSATGSAGGEMDKILDAQKEVVFELLDKLGVAITPAERQSLQERPTRDLQAFLLYSRGLSAEDNGDFGSAASLFNEAAARDPNFRDAGAHAAASSAAASATTTPANQMAGGGGDAPGGNMRQLADGMNPSVGSLTDGDSGPGSDPPDRRSGLPESQGQDIVIPSVLSGTIIIVIPRPVARP